MASRKQVITRISRKARVSKATCENVLDAFAESLAEFLAEGEKVNLPGMMVFEIIEKRERRGIDLNTGEPIVYPPVKSVVCRVHKRLRDTINGRLREVEDEEDSIT